MPDLGKEKTTLKAAAGYGAAVVLCCVLLAWVMNLWAADLSVPLVYGGDALPVFAFVKGVIENGWFLHNDSLGAPGTMDFHDYPSADTLHYALMKLLSFAVSDPIRVVNLYFLLTFPLTTLTTLFVLRRFDVGWVPGTVASLLYAFMPYHFARHLCHLFLASYYLIPPTILVMLWVYQGRRILFHRDDATGRLRFPL